MEYKKYLKINEAPLPPDEMPSGHYIKNMVSNNIVNNLNNIGKKLVKPYIDVILTDLKDMRFDEIRFDKSGNQYIILLPDTIVTKMRKLYDGTSPVYNQTVEGLTTSQLKQKILDTVKNTFSTSSYTFKGTDPNSTSYIKMKIDDSNRTHFPGGGINEQGLRGLGLGKKLYRALIGQAEYVCSGSSAESGAQKAWASLTKPQFNEDGSRDIDAEVYSFMLPLSYNMFAIATTRPKTEIFATAYSLLNNIHDKSKFQNVATRKANDIAVDPDFIQLCKDNSNNINAQKILSWVEPSPESLAAAAAEEERRVAAANAEQNSRYAERLLKYCGVSTVEELSSVWNVGDWIVVKSYLLGTDTIPVRQVTKFQGGTYYAYKPSDINLSGIGEGDERSTSNKSNWVKALPPAVDSNFPPGINGVSSSTQRRRETNTRSNTDDVTPTRDDSGNIIATENVNDIQRSLGFEVLSNRDVTYNFTPQQKRVINKVSDLNDNLIYIPNSEVVGNGNLNNGAPIFAYVSDAMRTVAINTKTGERINLSDNQKRTFNTLTTEYKRQALVNKSELTPGDLVYIRNHSKYFGYIARVLRTNLTRRGDNYIYLSVPGAPGNKITLTPISLDRLIPTTNESFSPQFESYLKQVRK